ncbi:MAG TPA: hypothetical protein PLN52_18920 [Opitutaceae bacterium]|nr:hypothetical protein [Opitutaceae bacterium]
MITKLNEIELNQVRGGFAPLDMGPDWWSPVYVPPPPTAYTPVSMQAMMDRFGIVADL